ncbi:MAG: hypothetical protein AAGJ80_14900 [Cyanobacteria bacterium J06553_1]
MASFALFDHALHLSAVFLAVTPTEVVKSLYLYKLYVAFQKTQNCERNGLTRAEERENLLHSQEYARMFGSFLFILL